MNKKGIAVITVLGVMLILSVLALSFVSAAKLLSKRGKNYIAQVKAKCAAEAGFAYAMALITEDRPKDIPINSWYDYKNSWTKEYKNIKLPGDSSCSYDIEILDCESMINVNACNYGDNGKYYAPINGIDFSKLHSNASLATEYFAKGKFPFTTILPEMIIYYTKPSVETFDFKTYGKYFCGRSYEWVKLKDNVYDFLISGRTGDILYNDNLRIYGVRGLVYAHMALNIIDFFDAYKNKDFEKQEEDLGFLKMTCPEFDGNSKDIFGRDSIIYITEVLPETSAKYGEDGKKVYETTDGGNGGEFIEIYNPCNYPVDVTGWELNIGSRAYSFDGDLQITKINPKECVIITDTTGRLKKEFELGNAHVVEKDDFDIKGTVVSITYKNMVGGESIIDSFTIKTGSPDRSFVGTSDPRRPKTLANIQESSPLPGDVSGFDNVLSGNISADDWQKNYVNADGEKSKVDNVMKLKYVYRDTGEYEYLKLRAADVDCSAKNIGELWMLDLLYFFDNRDDDYFDEIDEITRSTFDVPNRDSRRRLSGKININTASREVLRCLPGVDDSVVSKIINFRERERENKKGFKYAWEMLFALKEAFPADNKRADEVFEKIIGLITVKSNNFIVNVRGYCGGRNFCTIKALVDRNFVGLDTYSSTIYYPKIIYKFYLE